MQGLWLGLFFFFLFFGGGGGDGLFVCLDVWVVGWLISWFGHARILVMVIFVCLPMQGFFGWYFGSGIGFFVCLFC